MGIQSKSPASMVSLLDSALLVRIPSLNTHDLAMLIITLGDVRFPCSTAISSALVDAVAANAPSMNIYQIACVLRGLSQMGTKWLNLPPEFKARILSAEWLCEDDSIEKKLIRSVTMTLDSMSLMGARWFDLSAGARESIFKVLRQVDRSGDVNDLHNIIVG